MNLLLRLLLRVLGVVDEDERDRRAGELRRRHARTAGEAAAEGERLARELRRRAADALVEEARARRTARIERRAASFLRVTRELPEAPDPPVDDP